MGISTFGRLTFGKLILGSSGAFGALGGVGFISTFGGVRISIFGGFGKFTFGKSILGGVGSSIFGFGGSCSTFGGILGGVGFFSGNGITFDISSLSSAGSALTSSTVFSTAALVELEIFLGMDSISSTISAVFFSVASAIFPGMDSISSTISSLFVLQHWQSCLESLQCLLQFQQFSARQHWRSCEECLQCRPLSPSPFVQQHLPPFLGYEQYLLRFRQPFSLLQLQSFQGYS